MNSDKNVFTGYFNQLQYIHIYISELKCSFYWKYSLVAGSWKLHIKFGNLKKKKEESAADLQ